jgi:Family of unknown function (DUF6502)
MGRNGKAALARAAMSAVEPLVALFLELGITSPEAESAGKPAAPSDVRVSLVTGIHRNFVRKILDEPPGIAAAREQKGHPAGRVLEAWHSDPKYLDSSGKPRDLSEREQEPSFQTLVLEYLPGSSPGMVLAELHRAGLVQLLSEHRLRVRNRTFRMQGVNPGNVGEMGTQARELLETLTHNLRQPDSPRFCESTRSIEIDAGRLPIIRDLIARRTGTFLTAMEQELTVLAGSVRSRRAGKRVRVGLTAVETER